MEFSNCQYHHSDTGSLFIFHPIAATNILISGLIMLKKQ